MVDKLIRTKKKGVYKEFTSRAWGSYYAQVEDPLADADLDKDTFVVQEDFPKLPAHLWTCIVDLYFHYAKAAYGNLEAQVLLLRDTATFSEWKVVVPQQEVSGASVHAPNFNKCIDIYTGEEYDEFPVEGWVHAGSSHSHNTMQMASFSSTDDANELGVPGCHILVSTIDMAKSTYVITASIVMKKTRFLVKSDLILDSKYVDGVTFHPQVLTYIKQTVPTWKGWKGYGKKGKATTGVTQNSQSNWFQSNGYNISGDVDGGMSDPFYVNPTGSSLKDPGYSLEEVYWAAFDKDVEDLLGMGIQPKELIKRIHKIEDESWTDMYGGAL